MSETAPALTAPPSPPTDSDYDSILAAVMETARGRQFLAEYARRNRNADTGTLLAAIERIESLLQSGAHPAGAPGADDALAPLRSAIASTRGELRSAADGQADFGDVARAVEAATAGVRAVRDHVRDIAKDLQDRGAAGFLCDDLGRRVKELSLACMALDSAADDVRGMVQLLRAVERECGLPQPGQEEQQPAGGEIAGEPDDLFADIRALSEEEKVALFS